MENLGPGTDFTKLSLMPNKWQTFFMYLVIFFPSPYRFGPSSD